MCCLGPVLVVLDELQGRHISNRAMRPLLIVFVSFPQSETAQKENLLAQYANQEVLMRQSKFTETQIVTILKEADAGRPVNEIWRKYGISSATYYKWKAKYGGLEASDLKRLRELEHENGRLKRLYADLSLENAALKDVIAKKL